MGNAQNDHPILATKTYAAFWSQLQSDDELWYFKTPPRTWQMRAGRMGVAVTRNGAVIRHASAGKMN
jgi:hypothetical protein